MNTKEKMGMRLKKLRESRNLSQSKLAKLCGWGASRIGNYETGDRGMNVDDVETIARHLNVKAYEILLDESEYPDQVNVTKMDIQPEYHGEYPILGAVSAGLFREAVQTYGLEYLPTTERCSSESYWLIVDGHSMTAHQGTGITFPEGMHILVDPNRDYAHNNFVVAYCEQKNQATFKKLSIEPEGTFLVPLNPDPVYKRINVEDEFCEIAGVVVDAKWKLF